MARTRILGALSVDVDDRMSSDAHEPRDQLPLPTLDERASFYLRAVHGDRDFSSEEHANARDLILDAMAADISARSERGSPKAVLQDNALLLPDLEPMTVPRLRPDQDIDDRDIDAQHIDDSDDVPPDASPVFSEQVSQRPRLSWFLENRILYGVATVCSAAALAAALGYWAGTVSQTARSPDNSRLAIQAPPSDPSGQTPSRSDPRMMAEAQRELASALNVARLSPDEVAALLKHGRELVALGRFRFARMVLEQAAEAKNASAAFALGQTYDPLMERSAVRPDAPPDLAIARVWYEKAKDLGSPEAAQRLSQLPAATPVPTPRPAPR
jgi:TPR repeat protein